MEKYWKIDNSITNKVLIIYLIKEKLSGLVTMILIKDLVVVIVTTVKLNILNISQMQLVLMIKLTNYMIVLLTNVKT